MNIFTSVVVLCATLQVLFQKQNAEKTKVESVPAEPETKPVPPTSTPTPSSENRQKQSEKSSEAAAFQHSEVGRS